MDDYPGDNGLSDVDAVEGHRRAAAGEVLLLDVREDVEWGAGHAAGAMHIPMSRLRLDLLVADRPIVAVCRSGHRSAHVAQALQGHGWNIRNLTGGMQAWVQAGLPVVRGNGQPGEII